MLFYEFGGGAGRGSHVMPRFGGPSTPIGAGLAWGVHGERLVYTRRDSILVQPITGGAPALVAIMPGSHSVAWSPDGSKMAYVQGNFNFVQPEVLGNVGPSRIWIVSVDGGDPVQVTDHPSLNVSPVWMPDGRHLMFISNRGGPRDLYVVALDGAGQPRGPPVSVTAGLDPHSVSVSVDGSTAVYSQFTFRRNLWEVALPTSGSVSLAEAVRVTSGNQIVESHALSSDGRWLVYDSNLEGNQDIYIVAADDGEPRRLTTDPADEFAPEFSPDGSEIAFHSPRHGSRDLFLINADGTNEVRLTDDTRQEYFPTFSPDGLRIVFFFVYRDGGVAPAGPAGECGICGRPPQVWGIISTRIVGPGRMAGDLMLAGTEGNSAEGPVGWLIGKLPGSRYDARSRLVQRPTSDPVGRGPPRRIRRPGRSASRRPDPGARAHRDGQAL